MNRIPPTEDTPGKPATRESRHVLHDPDTRQTPPADGPTAHRTDAEDWALIRRIGAGDRDAFAALYARYYDTVYRFAFQTTRRLDLVEDVIHEVMLVVWRKAAETVPLARASTWILGIAYRKALGLAGRNPPAMACLDDELAGTDGGLQYRRIEAEQCFLHAMRELAPEQRAVLELVYHHGLNYREIADVLAVPENTVKTRVFHARRRLRGLWPELSGAASRRPDLRKEPA